MWYVRWAPRNQAVFEAYGETKDQAVQLLAGAWLTHNKAQAHPHRDPPIRRPVDPPVRGLAECGYRRNPDFPGLRAGSSAV